MTEAKFYLFDMDHTLIQADCDVTWKQFAVAHGLAPETALVEADRFFDDYNAGKLDIEAFHEFQFREFAGNSATIPESGRSENASRSRISAIAVKLSRPE